MRIHVLSPQHTRPVLAQSHCAFQQKCVRLGPMMKRLGYETILYSVGQPDNPDGWSEVVEVMTPEEQRMILGYDPLRPGKAFVGDAANVGSPLYKEFNRRLAAILEERVSGDDVIAATFGHAHKDALTNADGGFAKSPRLLVDHTVETGIGYPIAFTGYRVVESQAYRNWHWGKEQRNPWISEWVVPNYFDVDDWPLRENDLSTGYVLYMGRICDIKGLHVVSMLAKARPDLEFVICGQGDPTPYLQSPNIRYHEPVHGLDRYKLMHGARCTLMPTLYVEPFGGVSIESLLTGTPCITSDHSVFTETMPANLRCRVASDWVKALDTATLGDPAQIRADAVAKYSMEAVGKMYDEIFQSLPSLRKVGFNNVELP